MRTLKEWKKNKNIRIQLMLWFKHSYNEEAQQASAPAWSTRCFNQGKHDVEKSSIIHWENVSVQRKHPSKGLIPHFCPVYEEKNRFSDTRGVKYSSHLLCFSILASSIFGTLILSKYLHTFKLPGVKSTSKYSQIRYFHWTFRKYIFSHETMQFPNISRRDETERP